MNPKKAIQLSLLLHLSPLILFTYIPSCNKGNGNVQHGNKNTNDSNKIKNNKFQELESFDVDTITESDLNSYKKVIQKRFTARKCVGPSYIGIGIGYRDKTVTEVPLVYPAAKAGVEVRDILMDNKDYSGEVGTEVEVLVKKQNGTVKNYTMLLERICLREQ